MIHTAKALLRLEVAAEKPLCKVQHGDSFRFSFCRMGGLQAGCAAWVRTTAKTSSRKLCRRTLNPPAHELVRDIAPARVIRRLGTLKTIELSFVHRESWQRGKIIRFMALV
jgi:hypothetical protein